jgi:hypothetical protein
MNTIYKKIFILTIIIAAFLLSGGIVLAQDVGTEYAANLGLTDGGGTDLRVYIVNIVRFLLAFLALVAVVVIVYGGFLWMTSAGNPARLEKAKKTVIGAIIGLIIVIAAFAIVTWVIDFTNQSLAPSCDPACSTTEKCCGGNYCCSDGTTCCRSGGTNQCCGGGTVCCPGLGCVAPGACTSVIGPATFSIENTTPNDGDANVIRNVVVRFAFNSAIDAATVNYGTTFRIEQGASLIPGTPTVSGRRISFVPDALCPDNPCGATNCFDPFANYTVRANDIYNTRGTALTEMFDPSTGLYVSCGSGALPNCTVNFGTSDIIDCDNPLVGFDSFTQACTSSDVPIDVWASDGSLVNNIELYVDGTLDADNNNTASANPFNTTFNWDGSSYSVGDPVTFTATAYDIDDHSASVSRTLDLRAAHCCDGILNGGEEGVDCGGPDCAACDGAACGISLVDDCSLLAIDCHVSDGRCSSGFCGCGGTNPACTSAGYDASVNNCCLCESAPVIGWVAPVGNFCEDNPNTFCLTAADCATGECNALTPNGAPGNFVTIGGSSFGDTPGTVEFSNGGGWVVAPLANASGQGNPSCGSDDEMWTDNMIVVVVPGGIAEGPIRVTHGVSSNYDDTNGGDGPSIDDFLVNTIARPGLCLLDPDSAMVDATLTYQGIRLGGGDAYFGNVSSNIISPDSTFGALSGTAVVPNLRNGRASTFVEAGGIYSNYLPFTVLPSTPTGPQIISVDPGTGPEGQYVTITGSGFGGSRGASVVYFGNETTNITH